MKKLFTIIAALMLLTGTAQANWQAGGDVVVNSNTIQWRVYNSTRYTMRCSGILYGQTQHGQKGAERISVQVQPGRYITRYLKTWGNAYFIAGWANINCRI